jgi:plastocyanin
MDRPHHFPLLIAGIALGACGPASEASTDVPPSAETTLVIADFAFEERAVAAHASVRVINQDGVPHTVTGDGFDVRVGSDGSATAPGTYAFACSIHPTMRGRLSVS